MQHEQQLNWVPVVVSGIAGVDERMQKGEPQSSHKEALKKAEKMFAACGENALWFGTQKIQSS